MEIYGSIIVARSGVEEWIDMFVRVVILGRSIGYYCSFMLKKPLLGFRISLFGMELLFLTIDEFLFT